ncbi:MAG: SDR family NAD(P)-dependent oxidoreductase [Pseudomonadota bacterium]
MKLESQAVLVTGAQQGIGRAIAIAFAEAGADVAINYYDDREAAEEVALVVRAAGREAVLIKGDVADCATHTALVAAAVQGLGRLDHLVNNAGIYPRASLLEMSSETWDRTLDTNLKASCFMAQAFGRYMIGAGRSGSIVNMASLAAQGWPNSSAYTSSKGGIIALTRTLAMELADHGVRVNCISPGVIDTAQPRGGYSEEQLAELVKGTLAKRMGTAAEVASVALFLASDASSFVNGQNIHVNGGVFMA